MPISDLRDSNHRTVGELTPRPTGPSMGPDPLRVWEVVSMLALYFGGEYALEAVAACPWSRDPRIQFYWAAASALPVVGGFLVLRDHFLGPRARLCRPGRTALLLSAGWEPVAILWGWCAEFLDLTCWSTHRLGLASTLLLLLPLLYALDGLRDSPRNRRSWSWVPLYFAGLHCLGAAAYATRIWLGTLR